MIFSCEGTQIALFLGPAGQVGGLGNPEMPVSGFLAGSEDAGGLLVLTDSTMHTALPRALFHTRLEGTEQRVDVFSPSQRGWPEAEPAQQMGPRSPRIRSGARLGPHML